MRLKFLTCTVAAVLAVPLVALAGAPGKKVAQSTARGDYAVASLGKNVSRPIALYARVVARPKQRVDGAYTVVCSKGFGAGSKSDSFRGRTPYVRRMRMPYARPRSCSVGMSAQLRRSGFLKLQLYAKK